MAALGALVVFMGGGGALAQGALENETMQPLSVGQMDQLVRSGSMPYTLEAMGLHLRRTILHDRSALRARLWRLLQAYYRYEAETKILDMLRTTRMNVAAIYELNRQKQRRDEVEDVAVLQAHNALLGAERAVIEQTRTCQLILLELLETANLLEVREDGDAVAATGAGRADAR
jgi:hypothetical protein